MIVAAAAVRSHPGEQVSGDAAVIVPGDGGCLVALIDALGHGPLAAECADRAVEVVRAHAGERPKDILAACHVALRHLRGAAMAVAAISSDGSGVFAGVGNIRARVLPESPHHGTLLCSRGIIGQQVRAITEHEFRLPLDGLGILYSDGVGTRIDPLAVPRAPIDRMANELLRTWQRPNDDASLILFAHDRGMRIEPPAG